MSSLECYSFKLSHTLLCVLLHVWKQHRELMSNIRDHGLQPLSQLDECFKRSSSYVVSTSWSTHATCTLYMYVVEIQLKYRMVANFLWGENFHEFHGLTKVFSTKYWSCVCASARSSRHPRTYSLIYHRFAKVFSLRSFLLHGVNYLAILTLNKRGERERERERERELHICTATPSTDTAERSSCIPVVPTMDQFCMSYVPEEASQSMPILH